MMHKPADLSEKVVIITGSSTGIGKSTALRFGKCGATVIVCGRNKEAVDTTTALINQNGGTAFPVVMDVKDWSQIRRMVDTVQDHFGKIDVLVNNAGIALEQSILHTSEKEWDDIIDTNLKGTFLCSKAVLPLMIKAQRGVIVNVSSILGKTGIANMSAYCASKFGILGFNQAAAKELAKYGIRVYAICPGPTDTPLHRNIVGEDSARVSMSPDEVAEKILDLVELKKPFRSGADFVIDKHKKSFTLIKIGKTCLNKIKYALSK